LVINLGAKLNEITWPTVYTSGPQGYVDYPELTEGWESTLENIELTSGPSGLA